MLSKYKNILFDFDGVILDSLRVKDEGFRQIILKIDPSKEAEFLAYHKRNGGLSRFAKFRYLYEVMLNKPVTEAIINGLSDEFSVMMVKELTNPAFLIEDSVSYLKKVYSTKNLHIVSGTEQNELRFLSKELGVDMFFKTIEGSPVHKNDLVRDILKSYNYNLAETCLIGDSVNDYEAAQVNNIDFFGYNNPDLKGKGQYIHSFLQSQ